MNGKIVTRKILKYVALTVILLMGVGLSTSALAFIAPKEDRSKEGPEKIWHIWEFPGPPNPNEGSLNPMVRLPKSPKTKEEIAQIVLDYLNTHKDIFQKIGLSSAKDLKAHYFSITPGTIKTAYGEFREQVKDQVEDLEVPNTSVRATLKLLADGKAILMEISWKVYPYLASELSQKSLKPRVKLQKPELQKIAREKLKLPSNAPLHEKERTTLQYLPLGEGGRGIWVKAYEAASLEPETRGLAVYVNTEKVDQSRGVRQAILVDERLYSDIRGKTEGRGVQFDPLNTGDNLDELPLGELRVQTTNGNETFTDAEGAFQFPQETNPTTVLTSLSGRWADVHSAISPTLSLNADLQPGIPHSFLFNPIGAPEDETAQVNGYYHTTKVHNYLKNILGNALPGIDVPIPVTVNLQRSCNAFYLFSNRSINFFHAADGCINFAYDTVIYHEYGHFMDDMAGGIVRTKKGLGLSEGWGDVLSCYKSGQPLNGEGFHGAGTYIRACDNNYLYSWNALDNTHILGQAWAGFAWHLRDLLIQNYGMPEGIQIAENLLLPVVLANSQSIPQAVWDTVLRDDDDGTFTNGTPHLPLIVQAASKHQLFPFENQEAAAIVFPAPEEVLYWNPPSLLKVTIAGTANTVPFQDYQLFSGQGADPTEWRPVGPIVTMPIVADTLGTWDFCGPSLGQHTLKLVVRSGIDDLAFQSQNLVSIGFPKLEQPIITAPRDQVTPAISGNLVVWEDDRNSIDSDVYLSDIYLYDITTGEERPITTNSSKQLSPAISGNLIVWQDGRNRNPDIYLYDYSTGEERQITNNPGDQISPAISGNLIVWQDYRNGSSYYNAEIYLYDLSTRQERQITTDSVYQGKPAISDNRVVWEDHRNGNPDIYLYDYSTDEVRQITNNPGAQISPAISGDLITWIDIRPGESPNLRLYNLSTGEERQITFDNYNITSLAISNDLIVWSNYHQNPFAGTSFSDIYLYDLLAREGLRVTTNAQAFNVSVSGDRIVWEDRRNHDNANGVDIYLYQRPPQFRRIDDKTVAVGESLAFDISVMNPRENPLTLNASYGCGSINELGASFVDHGSGSGNFSWTPQQHQRGAHDIVFSVSDGVQTSYKAVTVTVMGRPPVFEPVSDQEVRIGEHLEFTVNATDPDGDVITLSATNLPQGASFIDHGNGSGNFSWTPQRGEIPGVRSINFVARDGEFESSEYVGIMVLGHPPFINSIPEQTVAVGEQLSFTVSVTDPDSDFIQIEAFPIPQGASFIDHGNNTGTFSWIPTPYQLGVYEVVFYAYDESYESSASVRINVVNANRPPELNPIGNKTVTEGSKIHFTVTATDQDEGDVLRLTVEGLRDGMRFVDNGNGTGDFYWKASMRGSRLGEKTFRLLFQTSDGTLSDTEKVTITVNPRRR